MSEQVNLKQIERGIFRASFADGMMDVMLGSVMAVLSLVPWLESLGAGRPVGYLISFAILAAVWLEIRFFKTRFTAPRLGLVTYGRARKNRVKQARLALTAMVLVTFGLVALTATGALSGALGAGTAWGSYLYIGAIFVITLGLMAFFLDYPRLYVYGWFLAFMYPFSEWLAGTTGWIFPSGETIFGTVITLIGIGTFVQFLRRHPLPERPTQTS